MSYDLMVFEKTKAPDTREAFMAWYEKQTAWEEDHDYQTIGVSAPALQNWFMEMKDIFPPMNGAYAPGMEELEKDGDLESRLVDYCIGREVIYAEKHAVGFFDVSGDEGEILLPDGTWLS